MSDQQELEFKPNQAHPLYPGKLRITIADARHFHDVVAFARAIGKEADFWRTFQYILMGRVEAVMANDHPGREGELQLWPENLTSRRTPSFDWIEMLEGKHGLVGGLNFDRHTKTWSSNT